MSNFVSINLADLPPLSVVEEVLFESVLEAMIADYLVVSPESAETIVLDSDPVRKMYQRWAYDKTLILSRVNQGARAVSLATSTGDDLDNLGALIPLLRDEGESDDSFRARIQLAPEAFSVAGPRGAYVFLAKEAHASVDDVFVNVLTLNRSDLSEAAQAKQAEVFTAIDEFVALTGQPPLGVVDVHVLKAADDLETGIDSVVDDYLQERKPLTTHLRVFEAASLAFNIDALLLILDGPGVLQVLEASRLSLDAYLAERRKIGVAVTRTGIIAALTVEGVEDVTLLSPAANVEPSAIAFAQVGTIAVSEVSDD